MAGRNSFQEIVRNIVRAEIASFMGLPLLIQQQVNDEVVREMMQALIGT